MRKLVRRATRIDAWLRGVPRRLAAADGIALDLRLATAGALVRLDHDRFRSAITHLVDNAVQAMDELPAGSERRLTIETHAADTVGIVVADTGPGIPPDVLPQVFEPLFSTRNFGTGLGLPTVKQIVEQHDGTIALAEPARRGNAARGNSAARRLGGTGFVFTETRLHLLAALASCVLDHAARAPLRMRCFCDGIKKFPSS